MAMLSASFWVMEALGIWSGPGAPGGNLVSTISWAAVFGVGGLVVGISAASIILPYGTRLTTPETVGIVTFSALYWALWGSTTGILNDCHVPGAITTVIGVFYLIIFAAALIQMVTHAPMTGYQ